MKLLARIAAAFSAAAITSAMLVFIMVLSEPRELADTLAATPAATRPEPSQPSAEKVSSSHLPAAADPV